MSLEPITPKKFYLSKTVAVGVLTILAGGGMALAEFLQKGDFSPAAITLLSVGVVNIILRFLTDTPISLK